MEDRPRRRHPAAAAAPKDAKAAAEAERQARIQADRQAKKRKQRVEEIEKRIAEKEAEVAAIEKAMTEPGFFDDRARAEKAAKDRENLMWEVNDLMSQWELIQTEEAPAS